jgi:predicted metal-dependent hydrolase
MDDPVSPRNGVELFNAGRYWEAHEAWEQAWIPDRHGPDRDFYKGLIQVAAGCFHYRRKNRRGAINKWRGGAAYLRGYLPRHCGLDLASLVALVEADLAALESAERQEWPQLTLPLIGAAPD